MKRFLLFLFFPLIGYSQMYGTYIEKLIAEKYDEKPWYQIEEITTEEYKIKDDRGSDAYLEKTHIDFDGNRMILFEKITGGIFHDYLIEEKNYDWTPDGGWFVEHLSTYKFGEKYTQRSTDGKEYEFKRSYPDGIWEQRSLPFGIRNGRWQKQEKDPSFVFRKELAIRSGKPNPSRVDNASPILCYKTVYIADHFIEQLVKDRKSGYCGMRQLPNFGTNRYGYENEVNYMDLKAMVKVFINDLKAEYGYWAISFNSIIISFSDFKKESSFFNKIINDQGTIIDAVFQPLKDNVLGVSLGIFNNKKIILRIDPEKWESATLLERWYTIYHELGHDVLNLKHGEGGRMMFNFSIDSDYKWEDFFEDRDYMFKYFFDNFNEEKFTSSPKTSYDEIITRDEAVKRLKDAKEMLDMGILTKDEYDSLSKKLKPIIIGN